MLKKPLSTEGEESRQGAGLLLLGGVQAAQAGGGLTACALLVFRDAQEKLVLAWMEALPVKPRRKPLRSDPFVFLREVIREGNPVLFQEVWSEGPLSGAIKAAGYLSQPEPGGYLSFRFEELDGRLIVEGDFIPPAATRLWDSLTLEAALGREGSGILRGTTGCALQVRFGRNPLLERLSLRGPRWQARKTSSQEMRFRLGPGFPSADFSPSDLVYLPDAEVRFHPLPEVAP